MQFLLQKTLIVSDAETCDAAQLAWLLDITISEVEQCVVDRVFRKTMDGRFPIAESVVAFSGDDVWKGFFGPRQWPKRRARR